jgi:hypothetical protein
MRRLISSLLLLAALGAAAFGVQEPEQKVLTIWGLAITPDDKGLDDVVRAFEAKNPHIKVRMLGMGAGGMNPQKLMTAIVGGVPPDMIKQDRFALIDWASRRRISTTMPSGLRPNIRAKPTEFRSGQTTACSTTTRRCSGRRRTSSEPLASTLTGHQELGAKRSPTPRF